MELNRIAGDFATAAQITPADVAAIAAAGFRTIVNNRPDKEAPDQPGSIEIEAEAKRLGLDYVHIPVVPGEMTETQARELKRVLASAPGPVLAFCRTGNRSGHLYQLARKLA